MRTPPIRLCLALSLPFAACLGDVATDAANEANSHIKTIHKDVVIVGGGASGAYSAVRLREDYNVSVIVVEKEGMLASETHMVGKWPIGFVDG